MYHSGTHLVFGLYLLLMLVIGERGAIAAMAMSSLGGILWRAWGWEQATGIHMLNVSLPLAFVTMVIVCLMRPKG